MWRPDLHIQEQVLKELADVFLARFGERATAVVLLAERFNAQRLDVLFVGLACMECLRLFRIHLNTNGSENW